MSDRFYEAKEPICPLCGCALQRQQRKSDPNSMMLVHMKSMIIDCPCSGRVYYCPIDLEADLEAVPLEFQ